MDIFAVQEEFRKAADISAYEAAQWLPLCTACASAIELRVKTGADSEENMPLIINAAAAMAFYHYILSKKSTTDDESFAAGDIKITQDRTQALNAAEKFYATAMEAVLPLFSDKDFYFEQVCDE